MTPRRTATWNMRPTLSKAIKPADFRDYYWLKTELIEFCRDNKLPTSGGKNEIQARIEQFLLSGKKASSRGSEAKKYDSTSLTLSSSSLIPEGYKSDELHREFFKSIIGEKFKFNVKFMKWMKENPNKTYQQAINEWHRIETEKKEGKVSEISSQFEYNQYIRDFFLENPSMKRADGIECWKYKRGLRGSNKYESADLQALIS